MARADSPAMDGVYTYLDDDGFAATWTVRTTCSPDCVAQVTTTPGHGFAAPLINGRHTVTRTVPDGVTCPEYFLGDNGSTWGGGMHPVTVHQSWDPRTLVGEVDFVDSPAPCGIPDPHDTFTLTKVG
ncbi:hypothetical protein A5634_19240 [Mycobacterium asiaticum]|uniref:Uncharacterized protein n=1 Tax=Mycobacterium asiaticum TaxID=1790 RepID=A0A1A3P6L2_MYCAS|nr:hypothetical protein [Mycobacterium asiaticum]OBK28944.1 hypothetical protein A5634_19240 [Mycobacterium asiaticum]